MDSHKEFYGAISKYTKAVEKEKRFKVDLDSVWDPNAL
jgi:hypothetical protein